jgi:hypothetical protein
MNLQYFLKLIVTDKFSFWFFESLLFLIFLRALWKDKIRSRKGIVAYVTRGEESRRIFIASASAFLTFVISIVFETTSHPIQGKIWLYLINLGIVVYLFFYSGWFTNKLVQWWIDFKQRKF